MNNRVIPQGIPIISEITIHGTLIAAILFMGGRGTGAILEGHVLVQRLSALLSNV